MSSEEDEKNILAKEVESWKGFEYAMRKPNATLFNKMLTECLENEVLDAMKVISELTGIDFEKVCRTGISTWWASIFDDTVSGSRYETSALFTKKWKQDSTELTYTGGVVLQPKKRLFHNPIVVDVASLYPTIAILHNISFDTVNCQCCKDTRHLVKR